MGAGDHAVQHVRYQSTARANPVGRPMWIRIPAERSPLRMRPYLAIIVDSFREALYSRVLWILLGLISLLLLACADRRLVSRHDKAGRTRHP